MKKSPIVAAFLGFLLGGFGLMYVSIAQGLAALGALIFFGFITGGVAAPLVWISCGIWGYVAANNYNEKLIALKVQNDEIQAFDAALAPNANIQVPEHGQYCSSCGTPARSGARFCTGCGGGL